MKKTLLVALALIAAAPVAVEAQQDLDSLRQEECIAYDNGQCKWDTYESSQTISAGGDGWDTVVVSESEENWYFESGRLERRTLFSYDQDRDPQILDLEVTYYENGRLRSSGPAWSFVGASGPFESYYENGQLHMKGTLLFGNWDGPFERYFPDGHLEARGSYRRGQACGEWVMRTRLNWDAGEWIGQPLDAC